MKIKLTGRIVLLQKTSTYYEIHSENPDGTKRMIHYVVNPSPRADDGHFAILLKDPWRYDWQNISKFLGATHSEQELPDKTYECAKKFAERYAEENNVLIFIDLTARGDKSKNREQEELLKKSLLEQKAEHARLTAEIQRSLHEKGLDSMYNYCVSGRPSACADIGD